MRSVSKRRKVSKKLPHQRAVEIADTVHRLSLAIRSETGCNVVECWPLELTDFASVKAFVDRFEKDGGRLDVLVTNAAMATYEYVETPDGYEAK